MLQKNQIKEWGLWCDDEDPKQSRFGISKSTGLPIKFKSKYEAIKMICRVERRPTTLKITPKVIPKEYKQTIDIRYMFDAAIWLAS